MASSTDAVSVAEVMTTRVRTASSRQTLGEIWKVLVDEGCHHLPIVEDGRLVGMVSTADLVSLARRSGSHPFAIDGMDSRTAADVMTKHLQTIRSDESVDVAIDRIGPGEFHALVVVDEAGVLAGIVTHHDLLHYLAS